jgi:hypothetical protein
LSIPVDIIHDIFELVWTEPGYFLITVEPGQLPAGISPAVPFDQVDGCIQADPTVKIVK